MPLTSKLRADYVELINHQLDTIPIDSPEDFNAIQQALQNIIQLTAGYQVPAKFKEKVCHILNYLKEPEDFVQDENDYDEYKQIIRDRINAKMSELQSLNATQKQSYIQNQQAQRSQTNTNQKMLAQRKPPQPGSEAHTNSEESEEISEEQLYNISEEQVYRRYGYLAPEIQLLINQNIITETDYFASNDHEREYLRAAYQLISSRLITVADAKQLTSDEINFLRGDHIVTLIKKGKLDITQAKSLTFEQCSIIEDLHRYIESGFLTLQAALQIQSRDHQGQNNRHRLANRSFFQLIQQRLLTIEQVIQMNNNQADRCSGLQPLISKGFLNIDDAKKLIFDHVLILERPQIWILIWNNELTVNQAKTLNSKQIQEIESGHIDEVLAQLTPDDYGSDDNSPYSGPHR